MAGVSFVRSGVLAGCIFVALAAGPVDVALVVDFLEDSALLCLPLAFVAAGVLVVDVSFLADFLPLVLTAAAYITT